MSTAPLRHPQAVRTPRASWWDRFAEAEWRLHDGMPTVWALMGAVVLLASSGTGVALLAMLLGWQP
jgi:hypothetical protein